MQEPLEDTKSEIRNSISKKDIQYNGQKTNNGLIKYHTENWRLSNANRSLKPGVNSGAPERQAVPVPLEAPFDRVTLKRNLIKLDVYILFVFIYLSFLQKRNHTQ